MVGRQKEMTQLDEALVGLKAAQSSLFIIKGYRRALNIRRELGHANQAIEVSAGLAQVALMQGDLAQAFHIVENILSHLETESLNGTEEPLRVYLICYVVLRCHQDQHPSKGSHGKAYP